MCNLPENAILGKRPVELEDISVGNAESRGFQAEGKDNQGKDFMVEESWTGEQFEQQ